MNDFFKNIEAEIEKVNKLRKAIDYLEEQLKNIDQVKEPELFNSTQKQVAALNEEVKKTVEGISKIDPAIVTQAQKIEGFAKGLSGLSDALNIVQDSMSLFGASSEQLTGIQNKLNTVIQITNSVQSLSNTIKETGALRTKAVTAATTLWNGAVKALNAQIGGSIALSKALVAGGIGILIVGIGLLISKYQSWKKEQQEINRLNKIVPEGIKLAAESAKKSAIEQTANVDLLYKATQSLTKPLQERKRAAKELQNLYPSYFGNMSQEEILAGKAASAYDELKKSILASAMARAYADKISENRVKILELEKEQTEAEKQKENNEINRVEALNRTTKISGQFRPSGGAVASSSYHATMTNSSEATIFETANKIIDEDIAKRSTEIGKLNELNEELLNLIDINLLLDNKNSSLPKKNNKKPEFVPEPQQTNLDAEKKEEEIERVRLESMRSYLKEYGTFQQQKLAIAEEYAEKIKKAESEGNTGEADRLRMQESSAMAGVELSAIKANVDWPTVFGEFGSMFEDVVKTKLEIAEKYTKTEEFKNADPGTKKEMTGLIDQMKKSLGGSGGIDFKKLGVDVKAYQDSLIILNNATIAEADAKDKLKKANEDYNKILKEGTAEEKKAAEEAVEIAKKNAQAASENVKTQTDIVSQNEKDASDTAINLKKNMDNVTEGMSKLASGGLKNAYDGLLQMGKGMGGAMEKVADSLSDVPIIGWILSIIDVLKDGLSNLVGGLLDSIFNAVSGILDDILSGDLFVTIGKSIRDGAAKMWDSITFGGFSSLMDSINGGNAKETAKTISELTASNDALKTSIDGLKDKISGTNGSKSIKAYDEAINAQEKYENNLQKILDSQMRYSKSHRSNAHKWDLGQDKVNEVNKLLGTNLKNSWDSFSTLTATQMNDIRTHLPDIWSDMINQGEYGDRFKNDWNNYADEAGKVAELTKQLQESLAQISFDSLRDSFVNTLMDMNSTAADFADDFNEYMMKSLLNYSVGEKLDQRMKDWYELWTKKMKDQGGNLSKDDIDSLRNGWNGIVQDGINERNALAELTGYTGSDSASTQQDSTKRGFETMSQDTGEELNGRFTALQMAGEEIKNQNLLQTEALLLNGSRLDALLVAETEHINIADETREVIVSSYLELQSIRENTGAIVKPINNMSEKLDNIERKIQTL